MSAASIFGEVVTGADVERWTLDVLRRWSSTYLAEMERQNGLTPGQVQRVRGWVVASSFEKWPEDQVPAVLVVSTGIAAPPRRAGGGIYRARWQMQIGCLCSARTERESHWLAEQFVAWHRTLLLQKSSLEGRALGLEWFTESYEQLDFDDTRSLYAGYGSFAVEVDGVADAYGGPAAPDGPLDPDTDPWPPWPTVLTVHTTVDNETVDNPLPQGGEHA